MTTLRFTKGHGTGNDFVLFSDPEGALALSPAQRAAIADATRGILDGDAPGSGTCGLAPHIDEVSAFGMQPAPALHPRGGIRPPASVGEGVGSDIEDAHDERAIEIGEGRGKAGRHLYPARLDERA